MVDGLAARIRAAQIEAIGSIGRSDGGAAQDDWERLLVATPSASIQTTAEPDRAPRRRVSALNSLAAGRPDTHTTHTIDTRHNPLGGLACVPGSGPASHHSEHAGTWPLPRASQAHATVQGRPSSTVPVRGA